MTLNVGEKRGKKGRKVRSNVGRTVSCLKRISAALPLRFPWIPNSVPPQVILTLAALALKSLLKDILEMAIRNVNWDMYNIL